MRRPSHNTLFYEEEESAICDIQYILENVELTDSEKGALENSIKRIRINIDDDPEKKFTNSIIDIIELISRIENSILIDTIKEEVLN